MSPLLKSCLIIIFGRIADVSLGTVRTMLTVKGKTLYAALTGFAEVFTWYVVVRDALSSEASVWILAPVYALGYALGTFVGGKLADKFISGHVTVEVITSNRDDAIPYAMRMAGYALTVINVNESQFGQPKYMILADVDHKKVKIFEKRIMELDPKAFIIVRDTKSYYGGYSGSHK